MVASTDIKFYVHTNTNAPQLQNAYGCMIDVLDACLVNGFGSQVVTSLVASGTTVTATFGTVHNFMQYQVIKLTGANQPEFNGEHRILSVPNPTSISFQLTTVPSVTNASGTISCSLPSLGWEKPFGDTGGKAAYRSTNLLLSSRPFLRVVDELDPVYSNSYAKYAKVGIVEDMSDINTMLGVQAPYDINEPTKNWVGTGSGTNAINGWSKWHYAANRTAAQTHADTNIASEGSRNWILVGNSDYFYLLPCLATNDTTSVCFGYGAFQSFLNSDQSNVFLSSSIRPFSIGSSYWYGLELALGNNGSSSKILVQRGYNQIAKGIEAKTLSFGRSSTYSGADNYIGAYNLTNIAPLVPVLVDESVLRGELIGFYWLLQQRPYTNYQLIEKHGSLFIAVNAATSTNSIGQVVLKIGEL